jgi:hypothetical protein
LFYVALPLFERATTAQINGRVTVSSGAPVPGATISVTKHRYCGCAWCTPLQPSGYSIAVQKEGFSNSRQTGLTLLVTRPGGQANLNVRDPFSGNIIPAARFDGVAANLM